MEDKKFLINLSKLTEGEKIELIKLKILSEENQVLDSSNTSFYNSPAPIEKHVVHIPHVLNEAYNYQKPSSFSRALRLDFGGHKVLLISGTASVNEEGKAEYIGDFKAQVWRTYRYVTNLLSAE
jgi:hypothetical protein